jgi:hypothetical protein
MDMNIKDITSIKGFKVSSLFTATGSNHFKQTFVRESTFEQAAVYKWFQMHLIKTNFTPILNILFMHTTSQLKMSLIRDYQYVTSGCWFNNVMNCSQSTILETNSN